MECQDEGVQQVVRGGENLCKSHTYRIYLFAARSVPNYSAHRYVAQVVWRREGSTNHSFCSFWLWFKIGAAVILR